MLTELRVRNLALIAAAELELGPGLTVLSGETGAGKTALLSSLKLLIGERGDSAMVGNEDDEARVEAVFLGMSEQRPQSAPDASESQGAPDASESQGTPDDSGLPGLLGDPDLPGTPDDSGLPGLLGDPDLPGTPDDSGLPGLLGDPDLKGTPDDSGLPGLLGDPDTCRIPEPNMVASGPPDEQEHLVVRRIKTDGRSRCYLDDTLVTVGRLADTLGPTVDLYGQHEHQSLLKSAEQLRLLDTFAGENLAAGLRVYQESLQTYKEALKELRRIQELGNSSGAEREQAAFIVREVEKVAPQPGEYELLESELPRLQNGEQLAEAAGKALELLRGENGALEKLDTALKALENLRGIDAALDEPLEQLSGLSIGLEEVTTDIGRYAAGIEYDPEKLQVALDRLGELDGLSRRFGPGMAQVFALIERSEQLLRSSENTEERINEAEASLARARQELEARASDLADLRKAASSDFLAQLNGSIADLALSGASLEFSVNDLSFERWTSAGSQSFELLYSPAPQAPARPLAKIASGGELSRVMLAIKSMLQSSDRPMTLVFDEIDAGIGGKTALAVAERLASLAQHHQVVVITHLAQIAAFADQHFLVSKTRKGRDTHTTISSLDKADRVTEIARMLSGTSDKEAIAHAEKLLKEARR